MSVPTAGIPQTSARTIGVVAVLGALALTAHEPTAGVGVVSGGALAAAVGLATESRRYVLPAVLLPVGVLGALGSIAAAVVRQPASLLLVAATVPLGVALAVVLLGGGSTAQLRQVGEASLDATVVAGCATVVALTVASVGGLSGAIDGLSLFPAPGVFGVVAGFVVAGVAVVAALLVVPPAAFTTPRRRDEAVDRRNRVAGGIVVAIGCATLLAVLLAVVSGVGTLGGIDDWLVESGVVRGLLAVLSALGVVVTVAGGVVRWSWNRKRRTRNPAPAVLAGTLGGFGAVVLGVGTLGGPPASAGWPGLFALATIVFGAGWVLLTRYAAALETAVAPAAVTILALSLVLGGIGVGAGANLARGAPAGAGVSGLATLVAIAAGLFVYRLGRFGRRLGHEVGPAGATRRTQLVHVGWLGVVSVLGLVVAVGGLWTAALFAPTLSVPATASVLAGVLALLAAVLLLFR